MRFRERWADRLGRLFGRHIHAYYNVPEGYLDYRCRCGNEYHDYDWAW